MGIEVWNGSNWSGSNDPKIYDGSWKDVMEGYIYDTGGWARFFVRLTPVAPEVRFSGVAGTTSLTFEYRHTVGHNTGIYIALRLVRVSDGAVIVNWENTALTTSAIPWTSKTYSGLSPGVQYRFEAYTVYPVYNINSSTVTVNGTTTTFATDQPNVSSSSNQFTSITAVISLVRKTPYKIQVAIWSNLDSTPTYFPAVPVDAAVSGSYTVSNLDAGETVTLYYYSIYYDATTNQQIARSQTYSKSFTSRSTKDPVISISSKTISSINVNVTHSDTGGRRIVLKRRDNNETFYFPSSTTFSTTSNLTFSVNFIGLQPNTRYYFDTYVIYDQPTLIISAQVSTYTKTKYERIFTMNREYGKNTTYFSGFAAHSVYLSGATNTDIGNNVTWDGYEPNKSSDGNIFSEWQNNPYCIQSTQETITRNIISLRRFNTLTIFYLSSAHNLSLTDTVTVSGLGGIVQGVSTIGPKVLSADNPDTSANESDWVCQMYWDTDANNRPYLLPSGSQVVVSGVTRNDDGDPDTNSYNYNKTWTVREDKSLSRTWFNKSTLGTLDESGSGGTAKITQIGSSSITVLEGTNMTIHSLPTTTQVAVEKSNSNWNLYFGPEQTAGGILRYTKTYSDIVAKDTSGKDRLVLAFKPVLPVGVSANSVYLESIRIVIGSKSSPSVIMKINNATTNFINSSATAGQVFTPVISTTTYTPTQSYSFGGTTLSNCFSFIFDLQRNAQSSCSIAEVEISYKYTETIDPGN